MTKPRGLERSHSAAYTERCRWTGCKRDRHGESDAPPLCTDHLIECASYIADRMRINLIDPDAGYRQTVARQKAMKGEVVYYVQMGEWIKIGTTKNLAQRMESLYVAHIPGALLAWEWGGAALENERHVQFREERAWANRELFNPSPRLRAHIESLLEAPVQ